VVLIIRVAACCIGFSTIASATHQAGILQVARVSERRPYLFVASLLYTVLRLTPGVSESLVQFIKLWAKQGPALVKGNLYIGGKQLKNAVSQLFGEGKLEQDTDTEKLLWAGAAKK